MPRPVEVTIKPYMKVGDTVLHSVAEKLKDLLDAIEGK